MPVSIATRPRSGSGSRHLPKQTGKRRAIHAAAIAVMLLVVPPALALPTVRFDSDAKRAQRTATCQAQVGDLCQQVPDPETEQCRVALTATCLRGELQDACADGNDMSDDGAVLCQKHNGLVVLRNACRGCKQKETVIGTLESAGSNGATGPTGPTGPAGPTGPTGEPGAPGLPGTPGAPGAPGAAGALGPVGPTGPAGVAGAAGAPGPTGLAGPPGTTGATGATGATGPTGVGSTVRVTVETKTDVSDGRPRRGDLLDATASCPTGQQATGGGVSAAPSNPSVDGSRLHTLESGPVPGPIPPTQWFGRIGVIEDFSSGSTLTLTVYVLCVPAP